MAGRGESGSGQRRRFFAQAAGRLLRPLADYIEQRWPTPLRRTCLRPPGALAEPAFLDTCYRCGACANECPVSAIVLLPTSAGDLAGTPMVDPDLAACTLCEGLRCTHACPSGALRKLGEPREVAMGTAAVYDSVCTRSAGEDCTSCVDHCPIGPAALSLTGAGPPVVHAEACVGCGLCQHHCPTLPKAIVVQAVD